MANNDVIELAAGLTPGEHFQNWLACRGIGEPVGERTLYQPEPEPGLWILVNGAVALGTVSAAGYLAWAITANGISLLMRALA